MNPSQTRMVWLCTPCNQGEDQSCLGVTLIVEGLCSCCNEWVTLSKPKRRPSSVFPSPESAAHQLGGLVLSQGPLKVAVRYNDQGQLSVPTGVCLVSEESLKELEELKALRLPVPAWYRHAHKCHSHESKSPVSPTIELSIPPRVR